MASGVVTACTDVHSWSFGGAVPLARAPARDPFCSTVVAQHRWNPVLSDDLLNKGVYLLANPEKPEAVEALGALKSFLTNKCTIAGTQAGLDGHRAVESGADAIVVLGGDGTLIGVVRSLGEDQLPLIGVNMGKLGFLAEYTIDEFKDGYEAALADASLISRRSLLEVVVTRNSGARSVSFAVNDCVIQAGPPFRAISLELFLSGSQLTTVTGDGLIVCTPSGSTAHNLSAGGPIVQAEVDAIVMTPLAPHSLTHKPLVIDRESDIEIRACTTNHWTTAIVDGQVSFPIEPGDVVSIRRAAVDCRLVRNPQYAKWHKLVTKLHWGRGISYD